MTKKKIAKPRSRRKRAAKNAPPGGVISEKTALPDLRNLATFVVNSKEYLDAARSSTFDLLCFCTRTGDKALLLETLAELAGCVDAAYDDAMRAVAELDKIMPKAVQS